MMSPGFPGTSGVVDTLRSIFRTSVYHEACSRLLNDEYRDSVNNSGHTVTIGRAREGDEADASHTRNGMRHLRRADDAGGDVASGPMRYRDPTLHGNLHHDRTLHLERPP